MGYETQRHNESLSEAVQLILDSGRPVNVDSFLAGFESQWQRIALQAARRAGMTFDAFTLRDIEQHVREHAWRLIEDPPVGMTSVRFGGLVVYRTNQSVAKMLRSRSSKLSGTSKIAERRSSLEKTRRSMVALFGTQPTDEELIAHHNDVLRSRNPRAGAQGAFARPSDLSDLALGKVLSVDATANNLGTDSETVWSMLASTDDVDIGLIDLMDVMRSALAAIDPDQVEAVSACLAPVLEGAAMPTERRVARSMGITEGDVGEAMAQFRSALIDALDLAASS